MEERESSKGTEEIPSETSSQNSGIKILPQQNDERQSSSEDLTQTLSNTNLSDGSPISVQSEESDNTKRGKSSKSDSGESDKKSASRGASAKKPRRELPLFNYLPSATEEAIQTFQVIETSIYTLKYLGDSGQDEIMSCDCRPLWDGDINDACGEDSECINRLTSMECVGSACGCGDNCQNQRFQKMQYANIDVIQTDMKGYGIRTNEDIAVGTFIYEYVGEVIDEAKFRRRRDQYDKEGIKHFYFMSLGKNEFIDATRKGGLGRFCNHSCNPNCYVDKWVVGDKLRMGIFAKRNVKAGEELVFDYNVDRYGAEPQACFCGEPNCMGYIGGKTQTESGTKLSHQTLEALGLDDIDSWSTATAKKKRPKKGEIDEDYIETAQPKPLQVSMVNGIMSSLVSCKEKWIVIKLLNRIHNSEDLAVQGRVMRLHGYSIMSSLLTKWASERNIVITILEILKKWPRVTKNKITSSKIEGTMQELNGTTEDEKIKDLSGELLSEWSTLQTAFRIPRRAPIPDTGVSTPTLQSTFEDERRHRHETASPPPRPPTPTKPRNSVPVKKEFNPPRGPANATNGYISRGPLNQPPPPSAPSIPPGHTIPPSINNSPLPKGWWWARDTRGIKYFYTTDYSKNQWNHPADPPILPQPNRAIAENKGLQQIIQQCHHDYQEVIEAKRRADVEKRVQEEVEKKRKEEERKKYEEEKRAKRKAEHEARKLKKKRAEKYKSMDPALRRKLIAKTHGLAAYKIADHEYQKRYKAKMSKEDFKLLMKGFSFKLADRTIEKGGKYADQPGAPLDDEYKKRIEYFVKQWMKDEIYCMKKLESFRTEFKETADQSPADGQPASSTRTGSPNEDIHKLSYSPGTGTQNLLIGDSKITDSSPKGRYDENEEDFPRAKGAKSHSPKHSPCASPSPSPVSQSPPQLSPQSPKLRPEIQLISSPSRNTPKRGRDDDYEESIHVENNSRVCKKLRSRSNSRSTSPQPKTEIFDLKGVVHHPQTLSTGA